MNNLDRRFNRDLVRSLDAVTVTSSNANTSIPAQRGIVYVEGYFYAFYYRTTDGYLVYRSSSDGVTWSSEAEASSTAVQREDSYAVFTDGTYIFIIWNTPGARWGTPTAVTVYTRRGTPSMGTIAWDTPVVVRTADGWGQYSWCKTANRYYIAFVIGYNSAYQVYVYYNNDGNSAWTQILASGSLSDQGYRACIAICNWPQYPDGIILVSMMFSYSVILCRTYDGSTWSGDLTFGSKVSSRYNSNFDLVAHGSKVHIVYAPENAGGVLKYQYFTTSWSSPVTVDSNVCLYPALSAHSSKLYLFYVQSSNILYRTMDYSTHTWSASTTWNANETSPAAIQTERNPSAKIGVIWRTGSASPYNIRFDCLVFISQLSLTEIFSLQSSVAAFFAFRMFVHSISLTIRSSPFSGFLKLRDKYRSKVKVRR